MQLLLKLIASCSKFVQPSLAANNINVADERIPRLHQRELTSLVVAVVPSMSENDIDVKLIFSAMILRTEVKTMDP